MASQLGPDGGGTRRSLGIPGDHIGGPGAYHESVEERVFREVKMTRICRYCEKLFIATKKERRFHDTRCKIEYTGGKIHDATYERWQKSMHELQAWYEGGQDDHFTPIEMQGPDFNPGIYKRPQDWLKWDEARRRLYLTIVEIRRRAERSRAIDQARAYKLLSEALLDILAMPKNNEFTLDALNDWYFSDPTKLLGNDLGYDEQSPVPAPGMEGWAIITKTWEERFKVGLPNFKWSEQTDYFWLDI